MSRLPDVELEAMPAGETPPAEPPAYVRRYIARLVLDRQLERHGDDDRPAWFGLIEWTMGGVVVVTAQGPARVPFATNIRKLYPLVERLAREAAEREGRIPGRE